MDPRCLHSRQLDQGQKRPGEPAGLESGSMCLTPNHVILAESFPLPGLGFLIFKMGGRGDVGKLGGGGDRAGGVLLQF